MPRPRFSAAMRLSFPYTAQVLQHSAEIFIVLLFRNCRIFRKFLTRQLITRATVSQLFAVYTAIVHRTHVLSCISQPMHPALDLRAPGALGRVKSALGAYRAARRWLDEFIFPMPPLQFPGIGIGRCDITLWTLSDRENEQAENKRMSRSNPYAFRYFLSLCRRTDAISTL